jgi:UPF0176 protein
MQVQIARQLPKWKKRCTMQLSFSRLATNQRATKRVSLNVNIYLDYEMRKRFGLNNTSRKTKTKFQVDDNDISKLSISSLRKFIESQHKSLFNQPYKLMFSLVNNTAASGGYTNLSSNNTQLRQFKSDDEVVDLITRATSIESHQIALEEVKQAGGGGGLALQLFIESIPNNNTFNTTLTLKESKNGHISSQNQYQLQYLLDMPDPRDSIEMTLLSFYKFHKIKKPDVIIEKLYHLWKPFHAFGRVYVANEGINGQMAVPTNVLSNFYQCCQQIDLDLLDLNFQEKSNKAEPKSEKMESFTINIDNHITRDEYDLKRPFKALHIRSRSQILVDGLSEPLKWDDCGQSLSPHEWHAAIENHENYKNNNNYSNNQTNSIILDCRNKYESNLGKFAHAIPLNTETFKESWNSLKKILENVSDKNTPILTYCTGGIRCVKINAYLKQKLNFTNISSLSGGIISYVREMKEKENIDINLSTNNVSSNVIDSKFKGVNYVFDERMTTRVTDDVLETAICHTCGNSCDKVTNCKASNCHLRFIQCSSCSSIYSGCCSIQCQTHAHNHTRSIIKNNENVEDNKVNEIGDTFINIKLKASTVHNNVNQTFNYCEKYSENESLLLKLLREETEVFYADRQLAARMISGHLQGKLLSFLASISSATSVLELGTFTGYATIALAEAIKPNIEKKLVAEGGESEPMGVMTCEIDKEASTIASKYFDIYHQNQENSIITNEHKLTKSEQPYRIIDPRWDTRGSDAIQKARDEGWTFDMVFIDADKKAYVNYLKQLLGESESENNQRRLLRDGAIVVVDNTLWKGLVLEVDNNDNNNNNYSNNNSNMSKDEKRQYLLANTMHDFNLFVKEHPKLTQVILPIRDGISCIRVV